jgi:Short repeat of unknown function (DUF308)
LALRGLLGVIFGVIALLIPIATILALVLLFSAYMIVDGAFAIYAAIRLRLERKRSRLKVARAGAYRGQVERLVRHVRGRQPNPLQLFEGGLDLRRNGQFSPPGANFGLSLTVFRTRCLD